MIFADPRHGSKRPGHQHSHDIGDALIAAGVEVESVGLEFGDFVFIGNGPGGPVQVGIELKTVSDFLTSMLSGRLAGHQIPGLSRYDRSYLIIEGWYRVARGAVVFPRQHSRRPILWDSVEKFITGLEESGTRIRWSKNSKDTIRIIRSVLYAFWQKPYEDHESIDTLYKPPTFHLTHEDDVTRRVRAVASDLPMIGHTRSKAVAERFRSIHRLVNATAEEWAEVDGVGTQIARGVVAAVHEEIPKSVGEPPTSRVSAGGGHGDRTVRHGRGVTAHTRKHPVVRPAHTRG